MQNAIANQPVGRQMGMRAGIAVAAQADIGMHDDAHRPPMRNLMHAVGDFPIGNRDMQDERFEGGDFHGAELSIVLSAGISPIASPRISRSDNCFHVNCELRKPQQSTSTLARRIQSGEWF